MYFSRLSKYASPVILFIAASFFCAVVGELACRLSHIGATFRNYSDKLAASERKLFDADLGNLGWSGTERHYGGSELSAILVGDSFTEGMGIEQENLFAAKLTEEIQFDWPRFGLKVYGGRGYGTLQELLILRHLTKSIRPNVVIIQACSNDLINNSFELERESYYQNALQLRPYWELGRVVTRYPSLLGGARPFLENHSAFAWYVLGRTDLLLVNLSKADYVRSVEDQIFYSGSAWPPFRRAVETTEQIYAEFVRELPDSKIFLFVADDVEPNRAAIESAARNKGIIVIPGVGDIIRQSNTPGLRTYLPDKVHWSARGHALVGKYLAEALRHHLKGDVVVFK